MTDINDHHFETGLEIAIIGMAGRFPGASNIYQFWENLKNGRDSISFFSDEELLEAGIDPQLLNNPHYVKAYGFLENIEYFDAAFFGYTPEEARIMDPQMRLFHECVWEALEDAGYASESVDGLIGLFAGASDSVDWRSKAIMAAGMTGDLATEGVLSNKEFLSTRISYNLDLKGPSFTLYTACSTSMVAVHLACRSLLSGDCDLAVAGGVSITFLDKRGYLYQEGMMQSADGHCRTFDSRAKGTVFGNGIGVVVLKSIEEAAADRDHIYAVIKGSAINNDGNRKVGYMAPSVTGQRDVITAAHQVAEIEPESIGYIEAHGTATVLGDPIEIKALKEAFNTNKKNFCAIGTVKSNFGHLDCAAGIASFIKTALALYHHLIPPTLNFQEPNPQIDFENSPFYVNTQLTQWKNHNSYPRRAGVSCFGIGGTNVHLVLEQAPSSKKDQATSPSREPQLLLISAKTPYALEQAAKNLGEYLKANPQIPLADASYTLQAGRRTFKRKGMLVCSTMARAIEILSSPDSRGFHQSLAREKNPPVIFMFPGQGAQYTNMGLDLYRKESRFRQPMDQCMEILSHLMGVNIKEILYPGEEETRSHKHQTDTNEKEKPGIHQTAITQPVIFTLEYALATLLMGWGIHPEAMIGYSFGEFAAACLSGVFSLEDALSLVVLRGQLIQDMPPGTMLSVPLPEDELKPLLTGEVSLAVVNNPACIVSGSHQAIETFEKKMQEKKLMCMRIHTHHAAHSLLMDSAMKQFQERIKQIPLNKPQIPYISSTTGNWITPEDAKDYQYWVRHLRETVRFSDGAARLAQKKNTIFVEVGPGRDLSVLTQRYIDTDSQGIVNLIPPSSKNESGQSYLLSKIGRLWLHGVTLDWKAFYSQETRHFIPLPTYPFESKPYWLGKNPVPVEADTMRYQSRVKKKADIADWFYLPQWTRAALPPESIGEDQSITGWLMFMDCCGLAGKMANRIKADNEKVDVIMVKQGPGFCKLNDREYILDPHQESHYHDLFKDLAHHDKLPHQIVHWWSVTGEGRQDPNPGQVREEQFIGFYSLLYLARALGKHGGAEDFQVIVVSDNMQEAAGEKELHPGKMTLLGTVKVIPQEYHNIRCRSLDIVLPTPGSVEENHLLAQLLEEFIADTSETIVAFRANHRWIQTFESLHLKAPPQEPACLRHSGVYLIIGAFGGVGLVLAEHMARQVNAKLILTSRRGLPDKTGWQEWLTTHDQTDETSRRIRKVQQLEALDTEVLVIAADAANRQQMSRLIRKAEDKLGPINGIIYAAGLGGGNSFRPINDISSTQCEQQFKPKVYGLLVLHDLFKDKPLDFCLLMSSTAAILGGLAFVAYSAANLFMDAFVNWKNHQCVNENTVTWLSVNWDSWRMEIIENQGTGIGASIAELSMSPQEGIDAFKRILSFGKSHRIIHSIGDLDTRVKQWIKLKTLNEKDHSSDIDPASFHARPDLSAPYAAPRDQAEQTLANIWQRFFGIRQVGIDDDFFELGGDSLKAMTVAARIQKEANAKIMLADLFDHPTIRTLAEYINKEAAQEVHTSIEPVEKKEYYFSSPAQNRLYLMQQMDLESTAYNMTQLFEVKEKMEKEKLEHTFMKLIQRHESLRTSFHIKEDQVVQKIQEAVEFNLEYNNRSEQETILTAQEHTGGSFQTVQKIADEFIRPFDLSGAPLFRVIALNIEESAYLMIVDMHHIISDGVSHGILIQNFIHLYQGNELSPLRLQYKDYAEWQMASHQKHSIKQQEAYWLNIFNGDLPVLKLPTDYPKPEIQDFEGRITRFHVTNQLKEGLEKIAAEEETTLFMVLLAVYFVLLAKISDQEDIVVGTAASGRKHADLEEIIGIFVNMLALRNHAQEEKTFLEFLKEVKENSLQAFDNPDYPFEELARKVAKTRDIQSNPLFDAAFGFQVFDIPAQENQNQVSDTKQNHYQYESKIAKFDLSFYGKKAGNLLDIEVEYSTKLFKEKTIMRFIQYFNEIITIVIENKHIRLKSIKLSHHLFSRELNIPQTEFDF
jgi:polyketide synthase PksJ